MSFSDLGLKPELLRAVADKGYDTPSPIQLQAIPAVLAGRDVLAGAQTGTGKTAGFVLPILQRLAADVAERHRAPRALVLTPTRELAAQVAQSVRDYGKYLPLARAAGVRRRGHQPADQRAPQRLRHPGRDTRTAARPRSAACGGSVAHRGAGARRGRPHARHGLHSRHQAHHQAAAAASAEPAVLRHLFRRHPRRSRNGCSPIPCPSRSPRATRPSSSSSSAPIACRRTTSAICWRT